MPVKPLKKQRGKPFKPGQSGNPKGRPKGSRGLASIIAKAILDGEAEALVRAAIKKALAGNVAAIRLCLERLIPPAKESPIQIALPSIQSARDLTTALAHLLEEIGKGSINPGEAHSLSALLETLRKSIETATLEERIAELDQLTKGEKDCDNE